MVLELYGDKTLTARSVGNAIFSCFPKTTVNYLTKSQVIYCGLALKNNQSEVEHLNFSDIANVLPPDVSVLAKTPDFVMAIPTTLELNGNIVFSKLTITCETNNVKLTIQGKNVDLEELGFDEKILCEKKSILNMIDLVRHIKLCCGKPTDLTNNDKLSKGSYIANVNRIGEMPTQNLKSKTCKAVLPWVTQNKTHYCQSCRNAESYSQRCKNDSRSEAKPANTSGDCKDAEMEDSEEFMGILTKLAPRAPENMKILIKSQIDALNATSPKGRRWDPQVISWCLSIWNRSPANYNNIKDNDFLILPSTSLLKSIKNRVHQTAGINQDHLQWMFQSAENQQIPPQGRSGGLIHDEMKIQEDIVVVRRADGISLSGFVDTGKSAMEIRTLNSKEKKQELATDVLQIVFQGYTGFRFPVAHYPTDGVKACDLHCILWEVVSHLHRWGFNIDFIMQDGGRDNRTFIKDCFPPQSPPMNSKYLVTNICSPDRMVALCQDYSHNIKKLRNNLLKSGVKKSHPRCIQLSGKSIVWQQWLDAVKWDRDSNSQRIHYKVTEAHLNPSSTEKMRNELAQDMLGAEALHLMTVYQATLHNKSALDSTIEFLEKTNEVIKIFSDSKPVKTTSDPRIRTLKSILDWFVKWRSSVPSTSFFSRECADDFENMLVTFPEICRIHLADFPHSAIVPLRFNSDPVENFFCQQRGIHNGNNTNPTFKEYSSTVNAIVIGQPLQSRKRKSNTGKAAEPFLKIAAKMNTSKESTSSSSS